MADTGARLPTASSGWGYEEAKMYDGNTSTVGGIIKVGGGVSSDCTVSAIAGDDLPAGATVNGVKWDIRASCVFFWLYEQAKMYDFTLSLDGGSNFSSALSGGDINPIATTATDYEVGGSTEDWGLDWSGFTDISQIQLKVDVNTVDGSGWYILYIYEISTTVYYTEATVSGTTTTGALQLKNGKLSIQGGRLVIK